MSEPVRVLALADLPPGTVKTADLNGRAVAIVNRDGQIHALDNLCPHAGGPLGDGFLDGDHVICPWHGWRFEVTTGACEFAPELKQECFTVKVVDDAIYLTSE